MNPLISVVIPTYNREKELNRALLSVLNQTYSNWEVLVVDNHSDDRTEDMICSLNDKRVRIFKIHNNGVIAASRNLGIKHSKGEYIAFLDSDDWWKSNKLEVSVSFLKKGADFVFHPLNIVTNLNQKVFFRKLNSRNLKAPVFEDLIVKGNPISNSSVVVKKSILNKIGGLSEDYQLIAIEDFDAWLRISKITNNFAMIPEFLGYYWVGGGNTSNPIQNLETIKAFEKRYSNELSSLGKENGLWWSNYLKGRAYYLKGCYSHAKRVFKMVCFQDAPLMVVLKISLMVTIINFLSITTNKK